MRKYLILVGLLVVALIATAAKINTSARCSTGADCAIGDGVAASITLDTDGADFTVDVTTNAAVLTATTTNSASFIGADAATPANTIFDTTGAGTVQIGSGDVTGVTVVTDGASLDLQTVANTLTLTAATTGTMTILGADAAGASDLLIDTSSTGAITIGSADVTSITVLSDGLNGSVVIDGSVLAQVPVASVASGAIAINGITLATASADFDIPDGACSVAADLGNWVTIVMEDASTVISITSDDASNIFTVPGLGALTAGNELDSVSHSVTEGQSITLTCLTTENWYMTSGVSIHTDATIAWADGGTAD